MMFKILSEDEEGARIGSLKTAHGFVETPFFMPVATQGTVKTLTFDEVESLTYEALIANAFILYLRPGLEVIKQAGGIHKFINWKRTIFTDSGGFQMLNPEFIENSSDKGVVFKSPFDKSRHQMTPERCIKVQNELGSDVAMVLDALVPFNAGRSSNELAVERTTSWAERCRNAHDNKSQLLFAITQGGTYGDLRKKSAMELMDMDFDGYGIGGLSIGEPKDVMHSILNEQTSILPYNKPRYLMGVGSPQELLESISSGVDIFDSTFPTRNARHNDAYTLDGDMNLSRGKFRNDNSPIEKNCRCYACENHSRAYIHHLLRNRETTGQTLMTIHNLFFIKRLINRAKKAIKQNNLSEFKDEVIKRMQPAK
jgi:queuine tRNA-ribosyltransferase